MYAYGSVYICMFLHVCVCMSVLVYACVRLWGFERVTHHCSTFGLFTSISLQNFRFKVLDVVTNRRE